MHRDKNDEDWQRCKAKVFEMDKSQCLLCQCMTVAESLAWQKSNPTNTSIIDPAHYKAVSQRPDLIYDPNNVFSLCREHHNRLDYCRHPITNEEGCPREIIESYWQRIIAKRKSNLASNTDNFTLPEFFEDLD